MEASVLFTIRSPHLPEVYDALEANGRFYLVMQLIEGQNLLQLLRSRVPGGIVGEREPYQRANGPCSEQEILNWLLPIMDVLQELHSRKPPIMHRDIKPGNIILTPGQTAVLVDFGLTKLYDPLQNTQTLGRAVSEGFSPVEQYTGKTSPQSDIYSLAATMYLLLTDRLPPMAVHRSMRDTLIPPRQLNPTLSPKMEQALLKALAVNAGDRFQSMADFARALREPTFNAYTDQTIVGAPVINTQARMPTVQQQSAPPPPPYQSAPTNYPYTSAPPQPMPSARPTPALPGYQPVPAQSSGQNWQNAGAAPGAQQGKGKNKNTAGAVPAVPGKGKRKGTPSAPAYSPLPPGGAYPYQSPGGNMMMPPQAMQHARPLPGTFGTGCLWGLLQGVLAALLILYTRKDVDFYLATLLGFLFYIIAGYRATRRGGLFLRGGGAGFWAGISSTIVFWLALGVGLAIHFSQRLQTISAGSLYMRQHPNAAAQLAWRGVQPAWPALTLLPRQTASANVLALLIGGMLIAWIMGLVGGLLGSTRHRARNARQRQRMAYP